MYRNSNKFIPVFYSCLIFFILSGCVIDFIKQKDEDEDDGNTINFDPELPSQLALGSRHTCMIYQGRTRCWGDKRYNGYNIEGIGSSVNVGELDQDIDFDNSSRDGVDPCPLETDKLNPPLAKQIVAGKNHTCILFKNGSVRCWGRNDLGQLGRGDTTDLFISHRACNIQFEGNPIIDHISAGANHTCALATADSTPEGNPGIYCWGDGRDQKLGNNDEMENIGDEPGDIPIPPVTVNLPSANVIKVEIGDFHSCALFDNNSISCWGNPSYLGNKGVSNPSLLTSPVAGTQINDLFAGAAMGCMQLNNRRVICWGIGAQGQLGYGCTNESSFIQRIASRSITSPSLTDVAEGTGGFCRGSDDIVSYLNYNDISQVATGADSAHSCILRELGSQNQVYCFGANIGISEELGPTQADEAQITDFNNVSTGCNGLIIGGSPLGYGIQAATLSLSGVSAVTLDRDVIANSETPVPLSDNPIYLATGQAHTCVILASNEVICWGINCDGQLGYTQATRTTHTGGGFTTFKADHFGATTVFP